MNAIKQDAILLIALQRTSSDLLNYFNFFSPKNKPIILIPRAFLDSTTENILIAAEIKYSALEAIANPTDTVIKYEKKLEELIIDNKEAEIFTSIIKSFIKKKLPQDIELIDALEEAQEKYNLIGFITHNEAHPRERVMRDWCLVQNIPTIHINHGAILTRPTTGFNNFSCQTFTLTSPNEKEAISSIFSKHIDRPKLKVCGMASWDKYALLKTNKNEEEFKTNLGLNKKQKIVTFFPTLTVISTVKDKKHPNLHLDGINYFLQAVAKLAKKFPNIIFIIKDRPGNDAFVEEFINIEVERLNINPKQLLYKFDYAEPYVAFSYLSISSLSTISCESILCQVPHLNVIHHPSYQAGFDPATGVPPVFYDELAEQLEPLLADSTAYAQLKNEQLASNSLTGPARDFCSSIRVAIEIANTFNHQEIAEKLNASLQAWQEYYSANPNLSLIELIENTDNPINYHWQNVSLLLKYDERFNEGNSYRSWLATKVPPEIEGQLMAERLQNWAKEPTFHLIYPVAENQLASLADSLDALDKQMYKKYGISILCTQACPNPELLTLPHLQWIETSSPFNEINQVINQVDSDWVMILLPGDQLVPDALFNLADYANLNTDWLAIYTDEDSIYTNNKGKQIRQQPSFKPSFNYELLLSTNYIGRCVALRRDAIQALDGLTSLPYLQNEEFLLRLGSRMTLPAIGHLPFISNSKSTLLDNDFKQENFEITGASIRLKHLEERNLNIEVLPGLKPNSWQIKHPIPDPAPKVAILLPLLEADENQLTALVNLIEKTSYPNWELYLGIAKENEEFFDKEFLQENSINLVTLTNEEIASRVTLFSKLAEAAITADFYCFYEADLRLIQNNWLENLVAHGLRTEIGLVAPRLVQTNGRIFGVGQVLGMNGSADDLYTNFHLEQDLSDQPRAWCDQNFSALNSSCVLISKANFAKFGLNPEFTHAFYLTDLGLRMQQQGLRLHWTPYSTVASLGFSQQEKNSYKEEELNNFYNQWFNYLAYDPAHNANLQLNESGNQPDIRFSYNWHPMFRQQPRILILPLHLSSNEFKLIGNLGYYLGQLEKQEKIRVGSRNTSLQAKADDLPHLVELARTDADLIICIGEEPDGYQGKLAQLKKLTGIKIAVYGQQFLEESSWAEQVDQLDLVLTSSELQENKLANLCLPLASQLETEEISQYTGKLEELILETLKKG